MANVLLVYPAPDELKDRRFGYSLDLLYLSSLLKQAGHTIINYLDYSLEVFDREKFYHHTDKAEVVVIEFDSFPLKRAINLRHGEHLVRELINRHSSGTKRKKKIILFGNDIAIGDYTVLKKGGSEPTTKAFDLEYDYALTGGYFHHIDTVVESLMRGTPVPELQPLDDLDQLPFPDRSLLTPYAEQGGAVDRKPDLEKSTLIRTSSGCHNHCIFCQRKAWHKKYLAHSIPYVLKEFFELKKHKYQNIWVTDDNFTYDLKRAKSLLKELSDRGLTGEMKMALSSWTRIDEEFLEAAKKAHVSIISFGVETADQEIQRYYRKKIDLERFRELIGYADGIGLYTVGNFIIGAPMETEETIKETFDYIRSTPFDQVNIKILDYMAGSGLYEGLPPGKRGAERHVFACKENGLNEFPLEELKGKIKSFKAGFRREREKRLQEKINRNGLPYCLLQ